MSFGVTEQTFGGATNQPTKKFDAVFQKGIAKGDTFFASSGDNGSHGRLEAASRHRDLQLPDRRLARFEPVRHRGRRHAAPVRLALEPASDMAFTPTGDYNPDYWQYTADATPLNVVWNESWCPCATGGGPSVLYPRPAWQGGVLPSARQPSSRSRCRVERVGERRRARLHVVLPEHRSRGLARLRRHERRVAAGRGADGTRRTAGGSRPRQHQHRDLREPRRVHRRAAGGAGLDEHHQRRSRRRTEMFDYNGDGFAVTWDPVPGWATTGGYDMTTGFGTPNAPAYVSALAGP